MTGNCKESPLPDSQITLEGDLTKIIERNAEQNAKIGQELARRGDPLPDPPQSDTEDGEDTSLSYQDQPQETVGERALQIAQKAGDATLWLGGALLTGLSFFLNPLGRGATAQASEEKSPSSQPSSVTT